MTNRIILHLDMNSYFASVEQQANPHLRHVPVGVCEHLGGIIIAPSVEAKRLGIKLGTTVWEARKICPKIVLLPVDPPKVRAVTERFLRILQDYTDEIELYSIDEAYSDITELCQERRFNLSVPRLRSGHLPSPGEKGQRQAWDNALLLGLEIKYRIRQEVGEWVSCSIGIGPNRLLSKIAADLDGGVMFHNSSQPPLWKRGGAPSLLQREGKGEFLDRICVIKPENVPLLYNRLQLTDVPGIGPRLKRALHKLGIFSLRELAEYPLENLLNQFGINGYVLHKLSHFRECSAPIYGPINRRATESEPIKSIGHSYTLPKAISKLDDIKKLMYKLSEKIGRRMRNQGARGNVVHYFHSIPLLPPLPPGERDKGRGGSFSRQRKLRELICDGKEIYQAAWKIFAQCPLSFSSLPVRQAGSPPPRRGGGKGGIKIMGLSVSGLVFTKPPEPLLEIYQRPAWLVSAMDKINDKYGELTIRRGRLLGISEEWAKDTVGFSTPT